MDKNSEKLDKEIDNTGKSAAEKAQPVFEKENDLENDTTSSSLQTSFEADKIKTADLDIAATSKSQDKVVTREALKDKFKTGAKPSEKDFADVFESYIHLNEDNISKTDTGITIKGDLVVGNLTAAGKIDGNLKEHEEIKKINTNVSFLTTTVDTEIPKIGLLTTKVDNIEKTEIPKIGLLTTKVDNIEKTEIPKIGLLTTKVDNIEKTEIPKIGTLRTDVNAIKGTEIPKIGLLTTKVDNIEKTEIPKIGLLTTKVDNIEKTEIPKIGLLTTKVDNIDAEFSKLLGILNNMHSIDAMTPLPEPRYYHSSSVVGNKIYVIGGLSSSMSSMSSVKVFDTTSPNSGWVDLKKSDGAVITLDPLRHSHSSSVVGNKIYVIGGGGSSNSSSNVKVFDTTSPNSGWVDLKKSDGAVITLDPPRYDHSSSVVGNKIYVIGGNSSSSMSSVKVFDTTKPDSGWVDLKKSDGAVITLDPPRYYHSSSVVGNKIYVIGGGNSSSSMSSVKVFDTTKPDSGWVDLKKSDGAVITLDPPRYYYSSSVVGNKIYVIGGASGSGSSSSSSSVKVFDTTKPDSGWVDLKKSDDTTVILEPARYHHSSSVVGNKIYVIGGTNVSSIIDSVEIIGSLLGGMTF